MRKLNTKQIVILVFSIYFLGSIFTWILIGESIFGMVQDSVKYLKLQNDIENARELWELKKPTQYEVEVFGGYFDNDEFYACSWETDADALILVSNTAEGERSVSCRDIYQNAPLEKIFDEIEKDISGLNIYSTHWIVEFDQRYGYIKGYSISCNGSLLKTKEQCDTEFSAQSYGAEMFGVAEFRNIDENSK